MPRTRSRCPRVLAFALFALGCGGGTVPVALDSFRDGFAVDIPSDPTANVLDDAFTFWGIDYVLVEGPDRGVLHVTLVETTDTAAYSGTSWRKSCRASIVADEDPEVLRHELGHVWRLDHAEDAINLMHPQRGDGETLTDAQWTRAQREIDRFLACMAR